MNTIQEASYIIKGSSNLRDIEMKICVEIYIAPKYQKEKAGTRKKVQKLHDYQSVKMIYIS